MKNLRGVKTLRFFTIIPENPPHLSTSAYIIFILYVLSLLIFVKAFQSVHHIPFVLCYNVLCDFVSLVFSLIRVHNALWEDITQGKR